MELDLRPQVPGLPTTASLRQLPKVAAKFGGDVQTAAQQAGPGWQQVVMLFSQAQTASTFQNLPDHQSIGPHSKSSRPQRLPGGEPGAWLRTLKLARRYAVLPIIPELQVHSLQPSRRRLPVDAQKGRWPLF